MNPTPDTLSRLQHLAATELSLPSRLGHFALLLASLTMTCIVTSLWLTEPALPARAQMAFAVMIVIGLSWVVFAAWVLSHRRMLFARDSVIAGRMAVIFTGVFMVGALATGVATGASAPYAAAALGIVMLAVAVVMLQRAKRRFANLMERRQILEQEIGKR